jgi:hypothetical protein
MNKKVLMLTITVLAIVMLTTPLVGSVQACRWKRTQIIKDDLFIRQSIWYDVTWDPIETRCLTFTHRTYGGYLMVVVSPSEVFGVASPILENPGSYTPYGGPLSWLTDLYGVSFTSRSGEKRMYQTQHGICCFINGNLELKLASGQRENPPPSYIPSADNVWMFGNSFRGYGTGGLKGVVVEGRWDYYYRPSGGMWIHVIELAGTIWYPAELAT